MHNVLKVYEELYRCVEREQHRYVQWNIQVGEKVVAIIVDDEIRADTIVDTHEYIELDRVVRDTRKQRQELHREENEVNLTLNIYKIIQRKIFNLAFFLLDLIDVVQDFPS